METFGVEKFSNNPVLINFYTGFQNYDMFCTVFRVVEPTATNMIRW